MVLTTNASPAGAVAAKAAATFLGVEPDGVEEHSYTEIVDALRVHGAAAGADIEELWRRMALSILVTNVDDHLRNHGFLHAAHGLWQLAPAFDQIPSRIAREN